MVSLVNHQLLGLPLQKKRNLVHMRNIILPAAVCCMGEDPTRRLLTCTCAYAGEDPAFRPSLFLEVNFPVFPLNFLYKPQVKFNPFISRLSPQQGKSLLQKYNNTYLIIIMKSLVRILFYPILILFSKSFTRVCHQKKFLFANRGDMCLAIHFKIFWVSLTRLTQQIYHPIKR